MTNYKFIFETGTTVRVPFRFQTRDADGVKTPIDIDGKRFVVTFTARGVEAPILVLDSDEPANDQGSKCEITTADEGRWLVLITAAEIAAMDKCFGIWEVKMFEADGEGRELWEGPFSRK